MFLAPPPGRRGNFYRHRHSRNRCGEEYIPVTQGGCARASGAQQVADRRFPLQSRGEWRFDFGNVSGFDLLIAVGRVLLLWVEAV
jgi:hypothetical protein